MSNFDSHHEKTADRQSPNKSAPSQPLPFWVLLGFIVALVALGIPFYLANFPTQWQENWILYAGIGIGEMIYLMVAFLIQPEPDTSDMGWFGGLINNPFRITDNFNRFLLFLKIMLLPGRLIAQAILNFMALVQQFQRS